MHTAKYRGLFRMRLQAHLTAFVVNVKRMMKLIEQKQPVLCTRERLFLGSPNGGFQFRTMQFTKTGIFQGSPNELLLLSEALHITVHFTQLHEHGGYTHFPLRESRYLINASCCSFVKPLGASTQNSCPIPATCTA
jgi:hypothetical protein